MELNINIITDAHCKVIIEDKTEYLNESNTNTLKGLFRYSDTTSIIILQHNKTTGPEVKTPRYDGHSAKYILVPVEFDGWFTVNYLVLPNKEWFDYNFQNNKAALSIYNIVYFTDGSNVYKYVPGLQDGTASPSEKYIIQSVSIEEILEINPIDTTISKISEDYISICFLQKCYVNLCLLILNDRAFSKCWNKGEIDSELIYKRDLVWMAINVIKYLTEFNLLAEVERIIELVNGCNSLCNNVNNINAKYIIDNGGCGCKK